MTVYSFDAELGERLAVIIEKFPDNFGWLESRWILPLCASDNTVIEHIAEARKIPVWVRPITAYKCAVVVYEEVFYDLKRRTQDMVLIHELEHFKPHDSYPNEVVLRKHEVNDWAYLVRSMGHDWQRVIESNPRFDVMRSGERSYQGAIAEAIISASKIPARNKRSKRRGRARV
jgi:phenylpropionate dioxygenase-like ring-hydroxylating dioxygenase large terminal subunit